MALSACRAGPFFEGMGVFISSIGEYGNKIILHTKDLCEIVTMSITAQSAS